MKWFVQTSEKKKTPGKKKASSLKRDPAPKNFVPQRWLPIVFPNGELNRPAYAVCVARQL